jgi:beta-galactosidase
MKLGVCYYPEQWPQDWWAQDAAEMAALGLTYVRIGEFAWSRIEPSPGQFEWAWLDAAMDTLHAAGLQIVLGTPTATPPKWLVDAHPEMLAVDARGQTRGFGSRRHYCFSSAAYRGECARIVAALAQRYAHHPGLAAWQTDNEYGCHDTVLSYTDAARAAFRAWLQAKYGAINALNTAWGGVFWSQEYRNFGEVDPPVGTVTEANPSHRLDYARFSSDQVVSFNRLQTDILRTARADLPVLHNFMGQFFAFDHFAVGADLDTASWDSYPLGFLEMGPFSPEEKQAYLRQGHPDFTAFHHDLYRGVGRGRWWVMEQQPGPVNWAPWNPAPLPGMVRTWTWEAFAHGAEVVSYFRWRQARFAQEQMHAGLQRPDRAPAPAMAQAGQVAKEIADIGALAHKPAPVALIWSYEAKWLHDIQPQGRDFDQFRLALDFYQAARKLGLDIDIIAPEADLSPYTLVLVPSLPIVPQGFAARLLANNTRALFGPRSGARTADGHIPPTLAPGPLQAVLPFTVTHVESLRPGSVFHADAYAVRRWLEHVEIVPGARVEVCAMLPAGPAHGETPIWLRHQHTEYFACWPCPRLLEDAIAQAALHAGLDPVPLPEGLRLRRRGDVRFGLNYNAYPIHLADTLPGAARFHYLLGQAALEPGGMCAWREK